ncbi:MAG: sigma-54-dependent Fis family transcriptional regulator [Rhodothermales bacterium]|nr:sigma-54-dependent Fis family transcriptional regulator [Rhodothermales bacterium]
MAEQHHILFVDDEHLLQNLFDRLFTRNGIQVTSCSSGVQAVELLKETEFDLVVTDFMMPDMDGLELLAHIREEYPNMRVIMITAHANVQHAVRTMKIGAIDYIPKPFSTDELVDRVQKILASSEEAVAAPTPKTTRSRRKSAGAGPKASYIGDHPTVEKLREMIDKVSSNKAAVFIQGESGTGKEILSRLIHQQSDRSAAPFVAVNCANLPRELVESHLFGHRKGAFTGAVEDMAGAFEMANGGTILLDEITEIEPGIQAKLLRVLQEQEIQKIGSTEVKKIDVRVVATSNRLISEAIASGIFREDLYHRLSVFPVLVPPLRERISDVPLLARHFISKYCELYGLPQKKLASDLLSQFQSYSWPGNVRQLENMVQRGVLLSAERTEIEKGDVFDSFFSDATLESSSGDVTTMDKVETIDDMERIMIMQALGETNNNQQLAARRLGISARTIRNKLKKYREEGHIA